MTSTLWLNRCAAELEWLYLAGPRQGEPEVPPGGWAAETASELADMPRYCRLEPEAAAAAFWKDHE